MRNGYLSTVLICISLIMNEVEHLLIGLRVIILFMVSSLLISPDHFSIVFGPLSAIHILPVYKYFSRFIICLLNLLFFLSCKSFFFFKTNSINHIFNCISVLTPFSKFRLQRNSPMFSSSAPTASSSVHSCLWYMREN